jgi:Amt family ammonium transporter
MVMAKAITLFKIFAKQKFKPHEILLEMNNDLNETNPIGTFITSIVGRYNIKSDLIEIANAGHQPALLKIGKEFKEFPSSSVPLAFTDGFSECMDENKQEIGIDGVKELILKHENSSLKKELENATEEIRLKTLKTGTLEKGIKENNDILDDDLTIIGIGK